MPGLHLLRLASTMLCLGALLAGSVSSRAQTGPAYDVTTIKPSEPGKMGQSWHGHNNRVSMENVTLRQLIKVAYHFRSNSQVIGGPDWIAKAHFDITARMDDEEYARMDKMSGKDAEKESGLLLQRLLADRFGLKVQVETRSLPQYSLVVDASGPKMEALPKDVKDPSSNSSVHNGHMEASGTTMESLAAMLSDMPEVGSRVVVDHTGLTGAFNFKLDWTRDSGTGGDVDSTLPGLFTSLKEQLGLRLEKSEGDVPVAVVEAAAMPQFD